MKVIFDNDVSTDDIIALIYLLSHPNVTVEAITVAGTGEAHGPFGAKNIADLLMMFGKGDIPIAFGSDKPCDDSGKPFPDFIRNAVDILFKDKGVPENPNPNITDSAVELMKKVLEKSTEKITFVATGPLTNIAQCLEKYPHLKDKIERIVIMGGAVGIPGNIEALDKNANNKVAEWNIYADPKAAEIVFQSGVPVTLVPLNATNQVPMTEDFYNTLSQQKQPALHLMYLLLKVFVDMLGMETFLKEFYLWDALAAMIALEPNLANIEKIPLTVDLSNAQTKPAETNQDSYSMIDVAMQIPQAKLILSKLVAEIEKNLLNMPVKAHLLNNSLLKQPTHPPVAQNQVYSFVKKCSIQ